MATLLLTLKQRAELLASDIAGIADREAVAGLCHAAIANALAAEHLDLRARLEGHAYEGSIGGVDDPYRALCSCGVELPIENNNPERAHEAYWHHLVTAPASPPERQGGKG